MPTEEKKKKHAGGRPSEINNINLNKVAVLTKKGFTDKEISDFFDINELTLNRWKKKNPEFGKSLKEWKSEADEKVEKALYQRALGYEYDEVTYEKSKIGGLGVKLSKGEVETIKHCDTNKTKVITKQVVPDVLAQIFWLKNRQPERWKDKTDIEHSMSDSTIEKFSTLPVSELLKKANELIAGKPTS